MDLTRSSRTSSVSNHSGAHLSPPHSPVKRLFKPRRSMKDLRRRKSDSEDDAFDFCCGGDEPEEPSLEQVSPLPLYNTTFAAVRYVLRPYMLDFLRSYLHQAMPQPEYEFPPRYVGKNGEASSPGRREEKRLEAEQARGVDALQEYFEYRSLARRPSQASVTFNSARSSTSSSSTTHTAHSEQRPHFLQSASAASPSRLYRSGSDGNLLTTALSFSKSTRTGSPSFFINPRSQLKGQSHQ